MKMYSLTRLGYKLSRSTRSPDTPEWRVIHYLARMHAASRDKILSEVPGASSTTLASLRVKRVVQEAGGVEVS